jgi:hypothetical protein
MNIIDQNKAVFNPLPRFIKINSGFCPDCDSELEFSTGGCVDCHIVPSLDPEFQQWLKEGWTDADGNQDTPHGPTVTVTTPDGHTATSHTAKDALTRAMTQREVTARRYVYNTDAWPTLTAEECDYWVRRTAEIMADMARFA